MKLRGTLSEGTALGGAMECRFAWRTESVPTKGPALRMSGNCWSRGQKSESFLDLVGWSVGCHQRLRSRWTYFAVDGGGCLSV